MFDTPVLLVHFDIKKTLEYRKVNNNNDNENKHNKLMLLLPFQAILCAFLHRQVFIFVWAKFETLAKLVLVCSSRNLSFVFMHLYTSAVDANNVLMLRQIEFFFASLQIGSIE